MYLGQENTAAVILSDTTAIVRSSKKISVYMIIPLAYRIYPRIHLINVMKSLALRREDKVYLSRILPTSVGLCVYVKLLHHLDELLVMLGTLRAEHAALVDEVLGVPKFTPVVG
jgi:hypothetical protein